MLTFALVVGICLLLIAHAVWMTLFVLDLFFETDRTTAAERARAIWKYLKYGVVLELSIGSLFILLIYHTRESFWWK